MEVFGYMAGDRRAYELIEVMHSGLIQVWLPRFDFLYTNSEEKNDRFTLILSWRRPGEKRTMCSLLERKCM